MSLFLKTKLCKFHQAGMCSRGASCKFAHGDGDLAAPPDFSKTEICARLLRTGECDHGASCKFAHSKEELRPRIIDRMLQSHAKLQGLQWHAQPPAPQEPTSPPQKRDGPRPSAEPLSTAPPPPPTLGNPVGASGSAKGLKGKAAGLAEVEAMSRASTEDDLDDLCPQPEDDGPRSRQSSSTSSCSWMSCGLSRGLVASPLASLQDPLREKAGALDDAREKRAPSKPSAAQLALVKEGSDEEAVSSEVDAGSPDGSRTSLRVKNTFIDLEDDEPTADSRAVRTCPALPQLD